MRHRPVRCLHGPRRWPRHAIVRDTRGCASRPRHRHHRRGLGRRRTRGAGRVAHARRRAVRLLPVGPNHVGHRALVRDPLSIRCRYRRRYVGQRVPLRHVRSDSCRHPRSGEDARGVTMRTRRDFLKTTALAAGALVIGFRLDGRPAIAAEALAPNAFIRIAPDNTITIISKHTELGQGSYSGLATILAEEMDADWAQIRVEAAPAAVQRYGNRLAGGAQMTGGSTSMAEAWDEM